MRITRADVAREANVSTATVSYVLNHQHNLPAETCRRVMEAVNKLGYQPDMIAKSMVTNKTHQLAIVMDSLLNPYDGEIALGFENAAVKKGYFINICSGQHNLDAYFDSFISRRLDGIMLLALPDKFHIEKLYKLIDAGIRIVMEERKDVDVSRISLIDDNYYEGMRFACEYLYGLGHRQIVYLDAVNGTNDFRAGGYVNQRRRAFLEQQEKHLGAKDETCVVNSPVESAYNIEIGRAAAQKLIASGRTFTAVICTSDIEAIGAIQALKAAGYRVPQDVSVVGFDHNFYAQSWTPTVTSVYHDKVKFGETAFDILNNNIENNITGFYKADVMLFEGESTAPPRQG